MIISPRRLVCAPPKNALPEWAIARRRELGRRPASARCTLLLSQDQLADRIGVERRTIQRYWGVFRKCWSQPDPKGATALVRALLVLTNREVAR
ncbi:hypothetical protein [Streptomyces sp. BE133]|uniref:hypothetical protein n=1 Tax=Streptomyces sp. BE133 TaxID=3002523 RepID=UPI002E75E615|nr:hypothetical protein [Streptomyces sp. BE133]MEE1809191.1 hypothetical protein [Streptomyces sp. BE133]